MKAAAYLFFVLRAAFGFAAAFDVVFFFAFLFAVIGMRGKLLRYIQERTSRPEQQHIEQFLAAAQQLVSPPPTRRRSSPPSAMKITIPQDRP